MEAKKIQMLEALKLFGVVRKATQLVGIAQKTHYRWRQQDKDYRNAIDTILKVRPDKYVYVIQTDKIEVFSGTFYLESEAKEWGQKYVKYWKKKGINLKLAKTKDYKRYDFCN